MCQATGSELQKDSATELVRGSCTDKPWRSSSCPLFSINPETDNVGGGIGVAKCQNTEQELYYCINAVQDQVNCTAKQNVLFFQQPAIAITTIGVHPTSSITRITTTPETSTSIPSSVVTSAATFDPSRLSRQSQLITNSATESPTPNSDSQPAPASDRSVTIGAAVGASIGILALGAFGIWLFFFLSRQRQARERTSDDGTSSYTAQSPASHRVYEAWRPTVGYNHHLRPQELPTGEHNAS
ncbi:hypothetical protein CGCS363_v007380 [Colletotrichum siamense]|uniref:uncharacterized protein n=1 Tax=Colletotrichum siamense TaxID=690259 RepID=UPI001872F613|nr:uncharacterized protein CGCS363_v007380 [Colletotrichum siamense]KAF5501652.1 hypothetical protein CGCS363_v007380 [Colletotrichum siamense]